jgi:hypothetical protein
MSELREQAEKLRNTLHRHKPPMNMALDLIHDALKDAAKDALLRAVMHFDHPVYARAIARELRRMAAEYEEPKP